MLVLKNSTKPHAYREAGGKGLNLFLMTRQGLPVPEWAIIGASAHKKFMSSSGIATEVAAILGACQKTELSPAHASDSISKLIIQAPLPTETQALIAKAYERLGTDTMISVRSSGADEDGQSHSFAGQLSSFLYVRGISEAEKYLKLCWASGYSERSLAYRMEHKLELGGISVAVVLQKMIDPDSSGVLFTCDPMNGDMQTFVASSVFGVGEGLVSGELDADTFWLNAKDGSLIRQEIVNKPEALRQHASGQCARVAVPIELHAQPSLTAEQLKFLYETGRAIAAYYGTPQDIEWALAQGSLYVLQTRPVTTLEQNHSGYPNLWDNSNIVESYGGLTSPLSFTFALNNYKNVYIQFCEILGVPRAVVKDMEHYLGNMLGCINGRVYYNLYNWYKLVGVLPGFRQNRQFMETMMGVSEELSHEIAERIRPHESWDTLLGRLRKARTGVNFIIYHFTIQSIVDRFLADFDREYQRFRYLDYDRMNSDQIFAHYLEMERVMLGHWKAPIINDFLCMVHFGVLKKLSSLWLADLDPNIQNDLLSGEGGLESAEPTKALIRLAGEVAANPDLAALFNSNSADNLHEVLCQSVHQDFFKKIEAYIDRFGYRCMSEMKLEEIDLNSDPTFLFVCLKNYLRSGTTNLAAYEAREKELRHKAEIAVHDKLSGLRRIIYFWSLRHARKAVKNRENTRFARTRAYGVGRWMFQAMGKDFAARGLIKSMSDVFYLTMDEIYGIHQGTLVTYNLKEIVDMRQKEYEHFPALEPKIRFLTRGPVYWQNKFLVETELPDVDPNADYDLKGLPCCPGIVEGIVKIVQSPQDDLSLDGQILVTSRTDPGWVPLYPSISGLLVERGSLLSHSAIVAREMGLPAVVGIKGLMSTLKSGMRIRIDGKAGTVKILEQPGEE